MTLRAWRLAHGWDMAQAAAALGIGLRAWYLLERATANDNRPPTAQDPRRAVMGSIWHGMSPAGAAGLFAGWSHAHRACDPYPT